MIGKTHFMWLKKVHARVYFLLVDNTKIVKLHHNLKPEKSLGKLCQYWGNIREFTPIKSDVAFQFPLSYSVIVPHNF